MSGARVRRSRGGGAPRRRPSPAAGPVDQTPSCDEARRDFLARRLDNYTEFLGPAGFATPDDIEALESCQRCYIDAPEVQWTDFSKGAGSNEHDWEDEVQQRAFWRRWRDVMTARTEA